MTTSTQSIPELTLTTHREMYGTTHYITRADGAHIAALAGNQLDPKSLSIGEAERLAMLFAAAPLLLDACKEAVGGIGYLARTAGVNVAEWEQWERKTRAAIAKAESR